MALARATNRKLCLAPFQRFYLNTHQTRQTEFSPELARLNVTQYAIPFQLMYSTALVRDYVPTLPISTCARRCRTACTTMHSAHNIDRVDRWRPGSTHRFVATTGIPAQSLRKSRHRIHQAAEVRNPMDLIGPCIASRCVVLVAATYKPALDDLTITNTLDASPTIKSLAAWVRKEVMHLNSEDMHACVHWRLEETKCRGLGIGLHEGRSADDGGRAPNLESPICFPNVPDVNLDELADSGSKRVIVRVKDFIATLRNFRERTAASSVLLATDCNDPRLLELVERETGVVTITNALPLKNHANVEVLGDGEVRSRVEQELCSRGHGFLGSTYSSWSETVSRIRHARAGAPYTRGVFAPHLASLDGALEVEALRSSLLRRSA